MRTTEQRYIPSFNQKGTCQEREEKKREGAGSDKDMLSHLGEFTVDICVGVLYLECAEVRAFLLSLPPLGLPISALVCACVCT